VLDLLPGDFIVYIDPLSGIFPLLALPLFQKHSQYDAAINPSFFGPASQHLLASRSYLPYEVFDDHSTSNGTLVG
jgi:hypothetical protein